MRRKLNLGFLAIVLLLWVICVCPILSGRSVRGLFADLEGDIVPGAIAMTNMKYEIAEIKSWTLTYIIRGNVVREGKTLKERLQEQSAALEKDAREHLERDRLIHPEHHEAAETIVDLSQETISTSAELIELKDQGTANDELLEKMAKEFGPVFLALRDTLDEHSAVHLEELSAAQAQIHGQLEAAIKRVVILGLVTTLLASLVGLVVDRLFARYITERNRVQDALRQRTHELGERVKELNCLYAISGLAEMADIPLEEMLQETVKVIPSGWQHPEIASARVILGGHEFRTGNFSETPWKHAAEIVVRGEPIGTVEVCYLEEKRESDGTPFLEGERSLISAIAGRLGGTVERKRAEEALRESEERYRALYDGISDAVYVLDQNGTVVDANRSACQLYGYSRDEVVGLDVAQLVAWTEDRQEAMDRLAAIWREGSLFRQSVHRTESGETFPVEINTKLLHIGDTQYTQSVVRDITERKQAEQALRESEGRFRAMVETTSDWVWEVDEEGVYSYVSPRVKELLGYEPEEVTGKTPFDLMPPEEAKRIAGEFMTIAKDRIPFAGLENVNLHKDGHLVVMETSGVPVFDAAGNYHGYRGIDRDITERKQAEQALRESHERYKELADSIANVFFAMDGDLRYTYWNKASEDLTEIPAKHALGKSLLQLFPDTPETRRAESVYLDVLRTQRPKTFVTEYQLGGRDFVFEISAYPSRDGLSVFTKDITKRKRVEEELAHAATHDPLTGLPNRTLFNDRLAVALAHARRNREKLAVMLLDLDYFKEVNDTLGHSVGDQLLRAVGHRLRSLLRESDTIARMGGDEFMLLLPGITPAENGANIAQKVLEAFGEPFAVDGQDLHITTSIGIAIYPSDGEDAETLIRNADIALYRAKGQGRNNYQCYTPAMRGEPLKA